MGIGGGKSSGSSQATLTPEQTQALKAQTDALTNTFLPAYQSTIGKANDVYGNVNPAATSAAQTAMDVAQQTGQTQQQGGNQAYQQGLGGSSQLAGYQTGLGQGLTGQGAGGVNQMAGYQAGIGQGMTGAGANQLAQLFSPQFKDQQIQASMQPAREEIRNQLAGQNAMYGGAGGLGSARQALADRNLSQLGEQRLGTVAAQTSASVEAQRQQAANSLLGAGQTASGQAGSLYGNILGAGQAALGAGQQGYGNLANLGQQGLTAANQAAAARIGYAQSPQDTLAKYAQVIYGTPQASTTPNFAGTQGSTSSSSGVGASFGKGSDISIKENIRKIGVLDNGINLYKFEYKQQYKDVWGHGDQIGVMAQEVEKIIPEAVGIHEDGYKIVNYSMVM